MREYHAEFTEKNQSEHFVARKQEALRRLKALHYFDPSVDEFQKYGSIMINEPPFGAHYLIDDDYELVKRITRFEKETGGLVYAVVRAFTEFGVLDSFLYVEEEQEYWSYFDENLNYGCVYTFTWNRNEEHFSDFGSIGFMHTPAAGLMRCS